MKTDLPPKKCLPTKCVTHGFGAVKLTRAFGMKPAPAPSLGGPVSTSQLDGTSTEVIGLGEFLREVIIEGKGSRRGPEKEKPE